MFHVLACFSPLFLIFSTFLCLVIVFVVFHWLLSVFLDFGGPQCPPDPGLERPPRILVWRGWHPPFLLLLWFCIMFHVLICFSFDIVYCVVFHWLLPVFLDFGDPRCPPDPGLERPLRSLVWRGWLPLSLLLWWFAKCTFEA